MNSPLISVIIPCYNVSSYVERAIQSILNQTYHNLEIWVIDDASTDDTLQKIRVFNDKRIRVVTYKENTKKVGAVNDVLKKVQGDFICFQDADDWSDPARIEEELKEFQNDPFIGVCFTKYQYYNNKNIIPKRIALTDEELRGEFLEFGNKKNKDFNPTICGTMMISKQVLMDTGGYHSYFSGRVGEDIHWIYRILKKFKGVTVNKVLYNYVLREGSLTQMQFAGNDAKYGYSWPLLSKIIYKDVHENKDVLDPGNEDELKILELQACEEALISNIRLLNDTKRIYETSWNFRIGNLILTPLKLFKRLK
jgi:glycosyltransferase involved in cell wall biosynthesis